MSRTIYCTKFSIPATQKKPSQLQLLSHQSTIEEALCNFLSIIMLLQICYIRDQNLLLSVWTLSPTTTVPIEPITNNSYPPNVHNLNQTPITKYTRTAIRDVEHAPPQTWKGCIRFQVWKQKTEVWDHLYQRPSEVLYYDKKLGVVTNQQQQEHNT